LVEAPPRAGYRKWKSTLSRADMLRISLKGNTDRLAMPTATRQPHRNSFLDRSGTTSVLPPPPPLFSKAQINGWPATSVRISFSETRKVTRFTQGHASIKNWQPEGCSISRCYHRRECITCLDNNEYEHFHEISAWHDRQYRPIIRPSSR